MSFSSSTEATSLSVPGKPIALVSYPWDSRYSRNCRQTIMKYAKFRIRGPYLAILDFHAVRGEGLDKEKCDEGAQHGQSYRRMSLTATPGYTTHRYQSRKVLYFPSWSLLRRTLRRISMKSSGWVQPINKPLIIGGNTEWIGSVPFFRNIRQTKPTPGSDESSNLSDGGCNAIELATDSSWACFAR